MHAASYAEIERVLAAERSLTDAAEAHGTLTGALCAATAYRFEDWLLEILPEGRAQPMAAAALQELYAGTQEALVGHMLEFQPLLPEEAQPLDIRTAALGQWCVGFLYGLGASALKDASGLPGDVGEVVRDLGEITRVGVDGEASEESNESAYTELVEFVRAGVQLLFDELGSMRSMPVAPADAPFH